MYQLTLGCFDRGKIQVWGQGSLVAKKINLRNSIYRTRDKGIIMLIETGSWPGLGRLLALGAGTVAYPGLELDSGTHQSLTAPRCMWLSRWVGTFGRSIF